MRVDTDRVPNLEPLMERMLATDDRYRYSVAWIELPRARARRSGGRC